MASGLITSTLVSGSSVGALATGTRQDLRLCLDPKSSQKSVFVCSNNSLPNVKALRVCDRRSMAASVSVRAATSSANSEGATAIPTIGAEAAAAVIKSGSHAFLDVRTPAEFETGHVEGAVNIPLKLAPEGVDPTDPNFHASLVGNDNFLSQVQEKFDPESLLVVSCMMGGRGGKATKALVESGFKNVASLEGGIASWIKKDLPLSKKEA